MAGRARAKIAEILATHAVPELEAGVLEQLDEIVEAGSKQALASHV
jgi:trimethylamine:corrinoid methyltransferase-like protein